jgi:hypothetical protein
LSLALRAGAAVTLIKMQRDSGSASDPDVTARRMPVPRAYAGIGKAGSPGYYVGQVEKVRSRFLSLRQLHDFVR